MDKQPTRHAPDLLQTALAAVQLPGLQWTILGEKRGGVAERTDAGVRLRFDGGEVRYTIELKRGLRRATLGATVHHLAGYGDKALLVADYITPPMADELRARGVQFIDTAGNAYLTQPPLYVWVKGQRPQEALAPQTQAGRAFQATGLQVLFTLLCKPVVVNLPYREIAALAGVAHGTVGWVMAELPQLGFVATLRKQRRLIDAERLLKRWVDAYAQRLRPKLLLGRYDARKLDWTDDIDAAHYGLLLGGEPAAARLTHHLRPGTATFYGNRVAPQLLIDQRLQPDRNGNVEVRRRFWTFEGETPGMVPHLLVYADLLAIGDTRCLETAGEMYAGIAAGLA
jgi:hypothetical protein